MLLVCTEARESVNEPRVKGKSTRLLRRDVPGSSRTSAGAREGGNVPNGARVADESPSSSCFGDEVLCVAATTRRPALDLRRRE